MQYTQALLLLEQYDHQSIEKLDGSAFVYRITYDDCRSMIEKMGDSFHSDVFGV